MSLLTVPRSTTTSPLSARISTVAVTALFAVNGLILGAGLRWRDTIVLRDSVAVRVALRNRL